MTRAGRPEFLLLLALLLAGCHASSAGSRRDRPKPPPPEPITLQFAWPENTELRATSVLEVGGQYQDDGSIRFRAGRWDETLPVDVISPSPFFAQGKEDVFLTLSVARDGSQAGMSLPSSVEKRLKEFSAMGESTPETPEDAKVQELTRGISAALQHTFMAQVFAARQTWWSTVGQWAGTDLRLFERDEYTTDEASLVVPATLVMLFMDTPFEAKVVRSIDGRVPCGTEDTGTSCVRLVTDLVASKASLGPLENVLKINDVPVSDPELEVRTEVITDPHTLIPRRLVRETRMRGTTIVGRRPRVASFVMYQTVTFAPATQPTADPEGAAAGAAP